MILRLNKYLNPHLCIFISTDSVYSYCSRYGSSKLNCENMVITSSVNNWVILRLPAFASLSPDSRNSTLDSLVHTNLSIPLFLPLGGKFFINYVTPTDLTNEINRIMYHSHYRQKILDLYGHRVQLIDFLSVIIPP